MAYVPATRTTEMGGRTAAVLRHPDALPAGAGRAGRAKAAVEAGGPVPASAWGYSTQPRCGPRTYASVDVAAEPEIPDLHERPAELLQRLLRFDTTNPPGAERECVQWLRTVVQEAGLETTFVAADPERPSLVARLRGSGDAPPLLLQAHVDVVPTTGQEWTHPPFVGEVADGFVWGRGALDMKGGAAMFVASALRAAATGMQPAGDVVLALLSDEEAGGDLGAAHLVRERPDSTWAGGGSIRSRSPRSSSAS